MSYILYITHSTELINLESIIKDGIKSSDIAKYNNEVQCIWFNYLGIYKNSPFFSNMTSGHSFDNGINICIDFNKLLVDIYNQNIMSYKERDEMNKSDLITKYKITGIGVYDSSLRHDIFTDYEDDIPYSYSLNNLDKDGEEELFGLGKLDNRMPKDDFDKMKIYWDEISNNGQEMVIYNYSSNPFFLNIQKYISNIIIYNDESYPIVREILNKYNLHNIKIHKSKANEYQKEIKLNNLKTMDVQKLCKNVKEVFNKKQLEKIVKHYDVSLPGNTKAEMCVNLYLQLLMKS